MRFVLLQPVFWTIRNKFFPKGGQGALKSYGIMFFCLIVCLCLYGVSLKVIRYFHGQNELGIILSLKIFEMAWIIMFAMLVFSCMVSAISSIFLSLDNEIIFAAPVKPTEIYFMRYISTLAYTSWMMILFSLPVFIAFGQVFKAGFLYWPLMGMSVLATAFSAVGVGMLFTVLLVNIFPARRTKDIVLYLSLCFAVFVYSMFRLLRPEELANPEKFSHFLDYLSTISTPTGPYVPGAWAANLLSVYLLDRELDWLILSVIVSTPFCLYFLGEFAMHCGFLPGYSKSQESFGGNRRFGRKKTYRPQPWYWIWSKEFKVFLRDSAEWSQIFMVAALVVVYLYNFKVLPLDRTFWREEYLTNLVAFVNIGLTGFVVTSLAARFVFPCVGAEGGAFYLVQSSPMSMREYLRHKYLFYCGPFTVLAVFLVGVSDFLLKIRGPLWWISLGTSVLITWTVLGAALGFGAIFADFKAENRAAALGGMGAVLFLLSSLAYEGVILFSGAFPAYRLVRKWLKGIPLHIGDFFGVAVWVVLAVLLSWFFGRYFFTKGVRKVQGVEGQMAP